MTTKYQQHQNQIAALRQATRWGVASSHPTCQKSQTMRWNTAWRGLTNNFEKQKISARLTSLSLVPQHQLASDRSDSPSGSLGDRPLPAELQKVKSHNKA